ncbi:hypothetical protein [Bacillus sp. E214]|uniref:hypothetical protein n=1 Tax=Bacillus sp. E214 TaxID=2587156 RepID=UPI001651BDCB|nr:hypothetical protein [Bacillus sp. E214]
MKSCIKRTGALIQEGFMPFYVEVLIEVKGQVSGRRISSKFIEYKYTWVLWGYIMNK